MVSAAQDLFQATDKPRLVCTFAENRSEIEDSLRLRYRIFAQEMGATINTEFDRNGVGMERDEYDAQCRHLLVRDTRSNRVVASTRILTHEQRTRAGGFYSANEFDLSALADLDGRFMEIGRTCVHPDYRRGAVIAVLWSGISKFIQTGGYQHLIGCASIELNGNFSRAHGIFEQLKKNHSSLSALQVKPRLPIPAAELPDGLLRLPPLLKAYINLGARVGGPPCWDPDFGVADLFMHLKIENLRPRYARHFRLQPSHRQAMAIPA